MNKTTKRAALGGAALVAALGLVTAWEGRETTALQTPDGKIYVAYKDIVGVWTACDGITKGIKPDDRFTGAECDEMLARELEEANFYVSQCLTPEISDYERAAYVSAAYNLGPSVVCGSTLQKLANSGERLKACMQLTQACGKADPKTGVRDCRGFSKAGGKFVQGLYNRRTDEQKVCLLGAVSS